MKKSKRLLSLLLCLVLVAALLPTVAMAEELGWYEENHVFEVTNNFATLTTTGIISDESWGDTKTIYVLPNSSLTIKRSLGESAADVNRWWRWSYWDEDTTNSINAVLTERRNIYRNVDNTVGKTAATSRVEIQGEYGPWNYWTGGGKNQAERAAVTVGSSVVTGTHVTLRSANGTRNGLNEAFATSAFYHDEPVRPGGQIRNEIYVVEPCLIKYDVNGGEGSFADQIGYTTFNESSSQRMSTNTNEPTRENYQFAGWKSTLNGKLYAAGSEFRAMGDDTLVAQWDTAFNVAHVQNGEVVKTDEVALPQGEPYNFVEQTTEGYLYGGTFTDIEFSKDTIASNDPTAVVPEAGRTYYISEVSDENLRPKTLATWSRSAGIYDVKDVYLFCAVNSLNYKQVGFTVNGHDIPGAENGQVAYEYITLWKQPDTLYTYNMLCGTDSAVTANAYMACKEVENFREGATFVPYWITLDGMKVTGSVSRTFGYNGEGKAEENKMLDISEEQIGSSVTREPTVSLVRPMKLMAVYSAGIEEDPAVIEEPIDTPDIPDIPDVPDVPEVKAVLNVVDGENAYELEITEDMVITPAGESGKLFAGWYADKAFTVPADLSAAADGDTVYAKYISDKYLQVKYSFGLITKTLSVTSAVDSKDYNETGFIVSTKGGDKTVIVSKFASSFALQNAKQLFGVEKTAALMNIDHKLSGLSRNEKVTVTPYLVTADGTTVYGTARTLTFNGLTMKG